jgi:hypothetical protein
MPSKLEQQQALGPPGIARQITAPLHPQGKEMVKAAAKRRIALKRRDEIKLAVPPPIVVPSPSKGILSHPSKSADRKAWERERKRRQRRKAKDAKNG